MYKNNTYKKQGATPLPFKWLSIEAIFDSTFSTYSDIWAFGVTLWELFSLAQVPYAGMEANQEFFYKLRDGYRMEKPKFATQNLYEIMLSCWKFKPDTRPSFKELEKDLSAFLVDSVRDVSEF
jgi:FMS-like tyrosine kinase 1